MTCRRLGAILDLGMKRAARRITVPQPTRSRSRWAIVTGAVALASCTLFVDTSQLGGEAPGIDGGPVLPAESGAEAGADVAAPDVVSPAECEGAAASSTECLAKRFPTDDLIMWLRADDGVETTADGHVTVWRDALPKLRPGTVGNDAKQSNSAAQPLRVTDAAGATVAFAADDVLELPPGFNDFSAGLSYFVAVWPQLDGKGTAGPILALGRPPVQDECARLSELTIDEYSLDYRAETDVVFAAGVSDGRGWDVFSAVHEGWKGQAKCPAATTATLRVGDAVAKTGPARTLTKGVRTEGRIGRSWYYPEDFFNGKIGEILVYRRALEDAEAVQVARYLMARWPRP